MSPSSITRYSDDNDMRWYQTSDGRRAMSVTTVLSFLDTDDSGLEFWKRNNMGDGDDKHHEHVYWYSAPRGTLAHYHCLNPLADEDLWGNEEQEAFEQITHGPTADTFDDASHDEEDIVYSILNNHDVVEERDTFEDLLAHTTLADIALRDISWVTDEFNQMMEPMGIKSQETDQSSNAKTGKEGCIAVERYLLDVENCYGGQCDLLYEDPGGNVVIADLKTSSSLRQKHVLQAVAYGAAVEHDPDLPDTVDRHEVIRLCPDSKEAVVHSHERPEHMDGVEWYQTDDWFSDSYGDYSYDSIDEMYSEFTKCIEIAKQHANDSHQ